MQGIDFTPTFIDTTVIAASGQIPVPYRPSSIVIYDNMVFENDSVPPLTIPSWFTQPVEIGMNGDFIPKTSFAAGHYIMPSQTVKWVTY